ncbi:hypothetical protein FRC06_009326 [Ceratobasidium sp. 370]|nr:hypothetical protein FRC06_009326 [Ceratobasidium sp. 370]
MSSDESSSVVGSPLSRDGGLSPVRDAPVRPAKPRTPPPLPPVETPANTATSALDSNLTAESRKDKYHSRVAVWRTESARAESNVIIDKRVGTGGVLHVEV